MESMIISKAWYEAIEGKVEMQKAYHFTERTMEQVQVDIPDMDAFKQVSIRAGFMEDVTPMSMQDFLQEYARNMWASLWDKDSTLRSMSFNCEFCPFREACHNDDTERDCAKFIADHISDMTTFHGHNNYLER